LDEIEALRLCDLEGLDQLEAAKENENFSSFSLSNFNLCQKKSR